MSRLPVPGGDDSRWGDILNDFLNVEHNTDGSLLIRSDGTVAKAISAVQSVNGKTGNSVTLTPDDVGAPTTLAELTDVTTAGASNAQVLSYDVVSSKWLPSTVSSTTVSDATTVSKGIVQLAGDLAGSNDASIPVISAGAVTGSKIASGTITDTNISASAAITKSKLAPLNIGDGDIAAISENKITNLTSDLSARALASRQVITSTGLTGGGDLTADRTLAVSYGTTAGTSAQGNDSRITSAIPSSLITSKGDLLAGTGSGTITNLPVGSNGLVLTADATKTGGMKWATPTTGTQNLTVSGLAADGTTDDAPAIQSVLSAIGSTGNHSFEILAEAPPNGTIYLNSTVAVKTSNTTLRFGSPVVFGPNGRLRIYGSYSETPTSNFPHLTADAAAGATTLSLADITPFSVGDYIEVRGDHDASGSALWFDYTTVTAVAAGSGTTGTITLGRALANAYQVTYTSGSLTEVVRIISSKVSSQANRGDRTVNVGTTANFSLGDIVQIVDDTLVTSSSGSAQAQNYVHREIAQVRQVVSSTQLLLSHALHHTYTTAQNGRVAKLAPVFNSQIRDASVTWAAMSTVDNAFEIRFAVSSSIYNCSAQGSSYSWLNQAFRQSDSYFCYVDHCYADAPVQSASGQGYGLTLYGATECTIRNSKVSGCRHSYLFYNGAAGNLITGCKSEDARISDYDLHGAESVDNWIDSCIAVGGDSVPDDSATPTKAACKVGNENHINGDNYNTFSNIWVVNYTYGGTAGAFQVVPASVGNTFRNSRVTTASYGFRLIANSNDATILTTDTNIENIDFADCTNIASFDGGASSILQGVLIQNCRFIRAGTNLLANNGDKFRILHNTWIDPALPAQTYAVYSTNVTHLSVKHNDMSGCTRGVKLNTCPNARITQNVMHDLTDTTVLEDAGGNTGMYFNNNDTFGFTPITRTSGTGPSVNGVVSIYDAYQTDTPLRHGFLEWNYDPNYTSSSSVLVSSTLYLLKISPQNTATVNNVSLQIITAGAGLTAAQNLVGLYDDTGKRLGVSADQSTSWTSTGTKTMSIGSVNLLGTRDYYVAVLSVGTTPPAVGRLSTSSGTVNVGLTNAAQRQSVNGTAQTSLPSTLTLSSNSGTNTIGIWVGLS